MRRQRPCRHPAPDQCDELATFHATLQIGAGPPSQASTMGEGAGCDYSDVPDFAVGSFASILACPNDVADVAALERELGRQLGQGELS